MLIMWRVFAAVIPRHCGIVTAHTVARTCAEQFAGKPLTTSFGRPAAVAVIPTKNTTIVTLYSGWQTHTVPCRVGDVLVTSLGYVTATPRATTFAFFCT